MEKIIVKVLASVLSRRYLWRLGRSLYRVARADTQNKMELNGEHLMQSQLLNKFSTCNEKLTVFDVGANIGDWSWSLLQKSTGFGNIAGLEIHAFEPVSSTFAILKKRFSTHPFLASVHVVPQALSNKEGISEIFFGGEQGRTSSLHQDAMNPTKQPLRVNKTTIDAYCAKNKIQVIHYLKCDSEGHDVAVLNGARQLFQEQRILACQFEYNHRWIYSRHYLKDIFDFSLNLPYGIGKITPKGVELFDAWHPELEKYFEGNYLIIHQKALPWFSVRRGKFDGYNTYHI